MITIKIPPNELWDDVHQEFINIDREVVLNLEHSLVSISKWESIHHKPFLAKNFKKTREEIVSYLRCMTLTKNVDPIVYYAIPNDEISRIAEYIEDPMSARKFKGDGKRSGEIVTSELIYYWMIAYNIPSEYSKWHLNRLLSLIEVCSIKNTPPKKVSLMEKYNHYKELNDARRKALNSKG